MNTQKTKTIKFEINHADTCLSGYWSGHRLPHVQIPVYNSMSLKAIKEAMRSELGQGYVMGNTEEACMLSADYVGFENAKYADKCFNAAVAAVNRLKPNHKGKRKFFTDLENSDSDGDEMVYAYFVFVMV